MPPGQQIELVASIFLKNYDSLAISCLPCVAFPHLVFAKIESFGERLRLVRVYLVAPVRDFPKSLQGGSANVGLEEF
jgi:hypothetical protein